MSCAESDAYCDCTVAFLQYWMDALISFGLALVHFCASLAGVVLIVAGLIGAGFVLLRF